MWTMRRITNLIDSTVMIYSFKKPKEVNSVRNVPCQPTLPCSLRGWPRRRKRVSPDLWVHVPWSRVTDLWSLADRAQYDSSINRYALGFGQRRCKQEPLTKSCPNQLGSQILRDRLINRLDDPCTKVLMYWNVPRDKSWYSTSCTKNNPWFAWKPKMLSKTTTAGQVSIPWLSILCTTTHTVDAKSLRSLMLLAAAQAWNIQVSWCCHKWSFPKKLKEAARASPTLPGRTTISRNWHQSCEPCCWNDQKVWWAHSDMILPLPSHKVPACAVYHQCEHSVPQACTYKSS